jgi:hypothetical protein
MKHLEAVALRADAGPQLVQEDDAVVVPVESKKGLFPGRTVELGSKWFCPCRQDSPTASSRSCSGFSVLQKLMTVWILFTPAVTDKLLTNEGFYFHCW